MNATTLARAPSGRSPVGGPEVTFVDLVDRLLGAGVVVQGEITLAVADIDLVNLGLQLIVGSADTVRAGTRLRPGRGSRS